MRLTRIAGLTLAMAVMSGRTMWAVERWSYCVVESEDKKYISNVFHGDFGRGYNGDPEVYGRMVNQFVDAATEQYHLKDARGGWCFRPIQDESRETVTGRRDDMLERQKARAVTWP